MNLEDFYGVTSQICFTLLGFWWAVVQFRYSHWMGNPQRRRVAHVVALLFLLPGVMSLMSMLAGDTLIIWRLTFGVAGLIGVAAVGVSISGAQVVGPQQGNSLVFQALAIVLYLLIALFAAFPELAVLGLGLQPLQLEGILLSLLVLLGVNLAWSLFAEQPHNGETVANE